MEETLWIECGVCKESTLAVLVYTDNHTVEYGQDGLGYEDFYDSTESYIDFICGTEWCKSNQYASKFYVLRGETKSYVYSDVERVKAAIIKRFKTIY